MNPNPPLQLRDIHLPPEPSWWPPAPGWWLLAVVAIALLLLLAGWLRQRWRARRRIAMLRAEFDAATGIADPSACLAAISQLLRRAARLRDPAAASLQGEAWLHFLDGNGDQSAAPFSAGVGRALLDGPYRTSIDPQVVAAVIAPARARFLALVAAR